MLLKAIEETLYWSNNNIEGAEYLKYLELKSKLEKEIDYYDFATQED